MPPSHNPLFDSDAMLLYQWLQSNPDLYPSWRDLAKTPAIVRAQQIQYCGDAPALLEVDDEAEQVTAALPYYRRLELAWARQISEWPFPLAFIGGQPVKRMRPVPIKPQHGGPLLEAIKNGHKYHSEQW